MATPLRVAVFGLISPHAGRNRGGTAISAVRLANHLASRDGVEVDLLASEQALSEQLMQRLDGCVTTRPIRSRNRFGILLELLGYAFRVRRAAVISLDTRANILAARLKQLLGSRISVWATLRATVAGKAEAGTARHRRHRRLYRLVYAKVDGVIAVSHGLAREFSEFTGVDGLRLHVIPELVVGPKNRALAAEAVDHPWLQAPRGNNPMPVLLGTGRLERGKDFETLLQVFSILREKRPLRMVILGRGPERERLTSRATALHIEQDVDFPGFKENPFSFMARADVFILCSRAEGFGLVLAEAMSVGCPVVSTDCPSGPREILDGGRYGKLVPVGDAHALAVAIEETLASPPSPEELSDAAMRYSISVNGDAYLDLIRNHMN